MEQSLLSVTVPPPWADLRKWQTLIPAHFCLSPPCILGCPELYQPTRWGWFMFSRDDLNGIEIRTMPEPGLESQRALSSDFIWREVGGYAESTLSLRGQVPIGFPGFTNHTAGSWRDDSLVSEFTSRYPQKSQAWLYASITPVLECRGRLVQGAC